MSSTAIAVIVIVLLVVVIAVMAVAQMRRTRQLRRRFGAEYDRVVAEQPSRRAAERDLQAREKRHAGLQLRDLDPQERRRYQQQWERTQAHFVEEPEAATREADALVTRVMTERGYPIEDADDFDTRVQDLSVEHAATLDHYREAHHINQVNQRGQASTEQLRQALMHYRALFADLLGEGRGGHPAHG
ncbi:hypothetical protein ABZS66_54930 [Dactylosporangium sp. NPDC005572]|uniref:hypothetical protein n=1 Tax=Dactylosporangium sp. NPDC005572 TaxID=3156889 RepID=UPI0033BCBE04